MHPGPSDWLTLVSGLQPLMYSAGLQPAPHRFWSVLRMLYRGQQQHEGRSDMQPGAVYLQSGEQQATRICDLVWAIDGIRLFDQCQVKSPGAL